MHQKGKRLCHLDERMLRRESKAFCTASVSRVITLLTDAVQKAFDSLRSIRSSK